MKPPHRPTLPLGIDFGRNRIRVALAALDPAGKPKLVAVATRDTTADPAAVVRDAVEELATSERRCVIGIAPPDALLRVVTLPSMSRFERSRAAVFQAARFVDYPTAHAALSLRRLEDDRHWVLGIARRSALQARLAAAKRARLTPLAIDDVGLALARVYADVDGTIDVTDATTRLTIFAQPIPYVRDVPIGATLLTDGIARSLGVDPAIAEERKRSIGFGGAGEAQRDELIGAVAEMLAGARSAGYTEVRRLVMIGNGARVPGLPEALERATGYGIRLAELAAETSDTLPADVLRAAAADWSVAYGLCLWDVAS